MMRESLWDFSVVMLMHVEVVLEFFTAHADVDSSDHLSVKQMPILRCEFNVGSSPVSAIVLTATQSFPALK